MYVSVKIERFAKISSGIANLFLFANAFIIDIPITMNKYVISLIGIGSVLYLIIPNIANKPRAKTKLEFYIFKKKT